MMKIAFYDRLDISEGCWKWTGSKLKSGYGIISFGGKPISAHRLSWKLHKGVIEEGKVIRHLCNNPICVNPDHLAIGTIQDNADDRVRSGNQPKGGRNNHAKLDDEKIKEIRMLLELSISGAEIGRQYGVSRTVICSIKNGRTWKHVT